MRHVLIDYYARKKKAVKNGGDILNVTYQDGSTPGIWQTTPERYLALNEALVRLEQVNPAASRVLEFKYFAGYTYEEIAEIMGISYMKVRRLWAQAKETLKTELNPQVADATQ